MVISATPDTRNADWMKTTGGKNSFAYKQMLKMGWSENTGLGKNSDGVVTSLRGVRTQGESLGIGAKVAENYGSEGFSGTVSNSEAVMSSLTAIGKVSKKSKKSRSNNDEDNTTKPKKVKGVTTSPMRTQAGRTARMMSAKDLNNKSAADMACIFGTNPNTSVEKKEEEDGGVWGALKGSGNNAATDTKETKEEKKARKEAKKLKKEAKAAKKRGEEKE